MAEKDVDLMAIGRHCSVLSCKRLDFLPFTCGHCKQIFCLDHRMPDGHNCQEVKASDVYVPVCPLCGELIKKSKNDDINEQVEKHLLSGCKELVIKKSKKTNRCSLKSCRQNEIMPFYCNQCGKKFCVRRELLMTFSVFLNQHRHAQDHSCTTLTVPLVACS